MWPLRAFAVLAFALLPGCNVEGWGSANPWRPSAEPTSHHKLTCWSGGRVIFEACLPEQSGSHFAKGDLWTRDVDGKRLDGHADCIVVEVERCEVAR